MENYFLKYYKFPFKLDESSTFVMDNNGEHLFDFNDEIRTVFQMKYLRVINGEEKFNFNRTFSYDPKTQIISNLEGLNIIQIRGWGGLTGIGGFNLPAEEATHVQDALGYYIANKLNETISNIY